MAIKERCTGKHVSASREVCWQTHVSSYTVNMLANALSAEVFEVYWLHHVTCLSQLRERKIFDGLLFDRRIKKLDLLN